MASRLQPLSVAQEAPVLAIGAKAAAKMLSIGTRLLWAKTVTGEIPSVRIGHRRVYSITALSHWLQEQAEKGGRP